MRMQRHTSCCDYCVAYKRLEVGEECELCGEKKEPSFTQTSSGEFISLSFATRKRMEKKRFEEAGPTKYLTPSEKGCCDG